MSEIIVRQPSESRTSAAQRVAQRNGEHLFTGGVYELPIGDYEVFLTKSRSTATRLAPKDVVIVRRGLDVDESQGQRLVFDVLFGSLDFIAASNVSSTSTESPQSPVRIVEYDYQSFVSELVDALISEPLQSGYAHQAEEIIGEAIQSYPSEIGKWIRSVMSDSAVPSYVIASIVHCLSRLDVGLLGRWDREIGELALKSTDVEIREAGVRILEASLESDATNILQEHSDEVIWLQRYIDCVIRDVSN